MQATNQQAIISVAYDALMPETYRGMMLRTTGKETIFAGNGSPLKDFERLIKFAAHSGVIEEQVYVDASIENFADDGGDWNEVI